MYILVQRKQKYYSSPVPQRIRYPLYLFGHAYIEIEEKELFKVCVYVQFIVSSLHYMIAIVTLLAMVFLNHSFFLRGGGREKRLPCYIGNNSEGISATIIKNPYISYPFTGR